MNLSGETSNSTINPGSWNSVAPRKTNSAPNVLFPVPTAPSTRVRLPRGIPPPRMASSPLIPVLTKSRSAIGVFLARSPRSTRATVAALPASSGRAPRPVPPCESPEQGSASCWRGGDLQERREPIPERASGREDVHPGAGLGVLRLCQEACADEGVERSADLLDVVGHEGGELFTRQERPGVPPEEAQ